MFVILDTTALYNNWKLAGPIATLAARSELMLCVPEVVLQEHRSHLEQELRSIVDQLEEVDKKFRDAMTHLNGGAETTPISNKFSASDIQNRGDNYEVSLREFLKQQGCRILDYPKATSLAHVVRRKSIKDFKDALIWASVVEIAAEASELTDPYSRKVALVSNDKHFGKPSDRGLHDEIESLTGGKVVFERYRHPVEVLSLVLKPADAVKSRVQDRLQNDNDYRSEISRWIDNQITDQQPSWMWNPSARDIEVTHAFLIADDSFSLLLTAMVFYDIPTPEWSDDEFSSQMSIDMTMLVDSNGDSLDGGPWVDTFLEIHGP